MKWVSIILALVVGLFMMFAVAHKRSLLRASLINGVNQLRVAQDDYLKHGYITNYPTSGYPVALSTNIVSIGGTQHQCFAEVSGGWGWEGGALAMTTNQIFIWLGARQPAKIVTLSHQPPLFGGPY